MKRNSLRALGLAAITALSFGIAETRAAEPHRNAESAPVLDGGVLDGAPYRIDIPAHWNGELVMQLHGFEPVGTPRTTPWPLGDEAPIFLAAGYAVAQSGYATQGWAVGDALRDNERLRAQFWRKYGKPRHTYLIGFSMGGYVALASLEHHAKRYDGVLSMCGANVPGTRVFEDALTSLVAFDYFFPHVAGLPANGLSDPAALGMDQLAVMQAVDAALKNNEDAAKILAAHAQVPREALGMVISVHYLVLRDLRTRAMGMPVDNRTTVYSGFGDDAAFNRGVHRYAGDPEAMHFLSATTSLTGRIGTPLVLQYNHNDPLIPERYHDIYPALVKAAGSRNEPVVLPSAGEGHCGFSPEQIQQAFQTLVERGGHGRKPSGS